jgi:sialic acid synthase SpsE
MIKNITSNYFITDTAFHHEGDFEFLEDLVNNLVNLDIQAVKFHLLFDVDDYMVSDHSAIQVIKNLSISENNWLQVFKKVKDSKKEIVALTNDLASLKYVNKIQDDYPIEIVELHSTGLNDLFLLKEAVLFKKTVMLGIGGSTFDEVQFAVDFLQSNGKEDILLMHGFQNYPTNYEDINFKRINFMRQAFDLPIGYADHTDPSDKNNAMISVLPAMLGVKVFEKHVTHIFGEKRIDAQAAISLDMMKEVIKLGNEIQKTLGEKSISFSEAELNYGNTGPMKKALVARKDIPTGTIIQLNDLAYKRTDVSSSLIQKDILKILGSEVTIDIQKDEIISYQKINYSFKKQSNDQFFIKK